MPPITQSQSKQQVLLYLHLVAFFLWPLTKKDWAHFGHHFGSARP